MVLGIKLEIDKGSIKRAAKSLRGGIERGGQRVKKGLGIGGGVGAIIGAEAGQDGQDKKGKKEKKGKSAFSGAAIGGFIGAIIGSLKPIQELLQVIGGILSIFLVPVLILLKPFLILFLKVGVALLKSFQGKTLVGEDAGGSGKAGTVIGIIAGIIAAIALALAGAPALLIAVLAIAFFFLAKVVFDFGVWLGGKLVEWVGWLWTNAILPAWEGIKNAFMWLGEKILQAFEWIKKVSLMIKNWFINGFNLIIDFLKKVPGFFLIGVNIVVDFFKSIPDLFLEGLKSIADLGSRIWNFIKDALGSIFGGGGDSTSVDDALITSSGQIVKLNQNDNVLAFQDFSQVENLASQGGGGGSNIVINVEGFVGDEETLADKIAKALNKSSRGSITNFG